MHELFQQFLAQGPILTDGAWGTQFQARGLSSGDCPDEWNLSHPDRVCEVARAYVEAGSQVIQTNTFRANRLALAGYDLADKTDEINRAGAEISLRAAEGRARVFGSIGPSGKMLITGQASEDELRTTFAEQASLLAAAGVDAVVIETMSDLEETKLALSAAKGTGVPVVACMVFDCGKQNDRTMMGATAAQVAQELTTAGADAIGANCGQGMESFVELCRQLRAATDLPIWIKPNAGIPQIRGDEVVYETTADEFAGYGPKVIEAGACFLGGCCGTGPEFIAALNETIRL